MRASGNALPDDLAAWVGAATGSSVSRAAPAGRGIAGTAWVVEVSGGERFILRWFDDQAWGASRW